MEPLERYFRERKDLSAGRKRNIGIVFKLVAKWTDHPFTLNREEMLELVERLEKHLGSEHTFNTYVAVIRAVYRWLNGGEFPDSVKHLKLKRVRREEEIKREILSDVEVRGMIAAADNPRDKAMVGVCWEGGFRLGELLGLNVGDVDHTSYGFEVRVSGKTGTRAMPIVVTAPLLQVWLYSHPAHNDKEAPLWMKFKGDRYTGVRCAIAHKIIKTLARRAGLKRNVHWHMLRHTQATFYARSNVNEAQMRRAFGWTKGSTMPELYTHLTSRDVEETVLALRGVKKVEKEIAAPMLEPVKCFRCGELNSFEADFCFRCAAPLRIENAALIVEKQQIIDRLLADPDVRELFERVLREKLGQLKG